MEADSPAQGSPPAQPHPSLAAHHPFTFLHALGCSPAVLRPLESKAPYISPHNHIFLPALLLAPTPPVPLPWSSLNKGLQRSAPSKQFRVPVPPHLVPRLRDKSDLQTILQKPVTSQGRSRGSCPGQHGHPPPPAPGAPYPATAVKGCGKHSSEEQGVLPREEPSPGGTPLRACQVHSPRARPWMGDLPLEVGLSCGTHQV